MRNSNIYITLILCFLFTAKLSAQIHINEYSASNLHSFYDNFQKTEDWIELYNASDAVVDLSGWHLSDKEDKPEKWDIPVGTMIPSKGFLIFLCSGRDGFIKNQYHTNFKLAQTTGKDIVLLSDADGNLIESFPLELTLVEHSRCRTTDGADTWAVCTQPSFKSSNNSKPQFTAYTQTPSMSLDAGFYRSTQRVVLTNNEPNSFIHYTLDGTNPTSNSPLYADTLTISSTQVVKARAFSSDPLILPGKMDFRTYFIDEPDYSLVVFSVAADEVIDLANGNGELIPVGSLEYFNTDKELEATSFGSLNRHGQDSWVLPHRSLDWISRDEMGYSKAVEAPLFSYSERDEYQKFMFRNSGDDNYPAINDGAHDGSTHIRDEYVQELAREGGMKLDTRAVERVILFLNGQYWGVYGMRDRPVDHDYTKEYYDQGKYDIQYLTTWGTTEIEYGGARALQDWSRIRDFILDNDMSDPDNYQIAEDSINMVSLIDYMMVNLSVVASDWLNYNTGWWRGLDPDGDHKKWGYILWDLDATFDYYINYSGVPDISPNAAPCDLEEISVFMDDFFSYYYGYGGYGTNTPSADCPTILNGTSPYPSTDTFFIQTIGELGYCCDYEWDSYCQQQYDLFAAGVSFQDGDIGKHEKIFLKLLEENATFKQLYYSRYADIMNTVYTCENMIGTLDRMLAVIEPEMPNQIARWGGSMSEWQSNVQQLKDFIEQRCMLLDDGMVECYPELNGPYSLTLMTEPDGIGEIDLNTLDIEDFPWTGNYFGGMENKIKARVFDAFDDEYVFSHWISTADNAISPDVNTRKATISLTTTDTLIAVFKPLTTSVSNLNDELSFNVYPNPSKDYLVIEYDLKNATKVEIGLYSMVGKQMAVFDEAGGTKTGGYHNAKLSLDRQKIPEGVYMLSLTTDKGKAIKKVTIMKYVR